ncbi:MAG: leucyl/phenylalanyl-tRNA--protein transferase [Thermodesulfobacteriota bacterium]|nr:leucyl/phenylalanyl-tRNA--protein transferase [Thermodesulfobacteriota bacterium]
MPVYLLSKDLLFPPPELAREDGLLAVGGDLSIPRLILAYRQGIFPWYNPGEPIFWWSPDPRLILEPPDLHVSRRTERIIRQERFQVTLDRAFKEVIRTCSETRMKRGEGTWLTPEMIDAYTELHYLGKTHSVETWQGDRLVGGLYGIAMGRVFFGESMFTKVSDASKAAFVTLVRQLSEWGFAMIDCQVTTWHLLSLGAKEIPRSFFLERLKKLTDLPSKAPSGKWS